MKTLFELDARGLTIREADNLIDSIQGAIQTMIEAEGFKFTISVNPESNMLSYVVEDKV